ncbi:MAG: ATP-binding protein, partial [Chloroflexota bacterium]|nr:ATP-binding protein [Chloroflexota bacterium]
IKDLITRIAQAVLQNMSRPDQTIRVSVEGVDFALPSQKATSLALAANELIQNSVEHAFVGRKEGTIAVQLAEEPSRWCITVQDDGVGVPDSAAHRLGLGIVEMLIVEDLRGEFTLTRKAGSTALLCIPKAHEGLL